MSDSRVTILTDAMHRIAYATDASIYREMPLGVAYPHYADDIKALLDEARRRHTHLIPRAAGTSIAGQVVGSGIVVDISRYMNRILEINAAQRWVRVEPGVVRDELNMALKPYRLFFSPETSTSNRCCIGGMVGNNSCGTHSLVYGSTRHHVIGLKGILSDGTDFECTSDNFTFDPDSRVGKQVSELLNKWHNDKAVRQLLTDSFPDRSLRRRSCGYALDECLEGDSINLPALLTGSEGTLAFITEITLSLDPLPKPSALLIQKLGDMDEAWPANLALLTKHPTAVELIDGEILKLALGNPEARRNMEALKLDTNHLPAALLVAEFNADELPTDSYQCVTTSEQIASVWNLRKAGLGVLTGTDSDAKPIGVIEDTAVAPERLDAYMRDFRSMMAELGLSCVYYGHISTGELHLRPILDVKQPKDRKLFREVATRTAQLVKKHRGSLSGEHGDGRLRGEFIPLMYGKEVYDLFCQLKDAFDPDKLLNMGKIVHTPPMDQFLRYEVNQPYTIAASASRDAAETLMRQIERCNGSGDCRKFNLIGGTMCPAFKVSGDELMTTRARANVLREVLTRGSLPQSKEVQQVLSSCLACKACKSECPSNVDMTRLRSQVLQLYYNQTHVPFRVMMISLMAQIERIGSWVPKIYNWFATTNWTAKILKNMVHFAAERHIPTLSRYTMRQLIAKEVNHQSSIPSDRALSGQRIINHQSKKVYLFADEFTNYMEAELGLTFARLLTQLGYQVIVPKHTESGRAPISKGWLKLAAKYATKNVKLLAPLISEQAPLVGIEPSCILSFRDEYPDLMPTAELKQQAQQLAPNCLLYDEFLLREIQAGRIDPAVFKHLTNDIWLHGHCHQKALVGVSKTAQLLQYTTSGQVHVIPSGCCGMAGSYGYDKDHYATSMAIGEMVLFPAVRKAASDDIIAAPGTSCREHILHGTNIKAVHPIQVLFDA